MIIIRLSSLGVQGLLRPWLHKSILPACLPACLPASKPNYQVQTGNKKNQSASLDFAFFFFFFLIFSWLDEGSPASGTSPSHDVSQLLTRIVRRTEQNSTQKTEKENVKGEEEEIARCCFSQVVVHQVSDKAPETICLLILIFNLFLWLFYCG